MKNKVIRLLSILLIIFEVMFYSNIVLAASGDISGKTLTGLFDGTMLGGQSSGVNVSDGVEIAKEVIGIILAAVRIIAVSLSIIVLTYLGIKYMSAAPSEKANIKNQCITFAIGAIIVVAASTILDIVRQFAQNIGE